MNRTSLLVISAAALAACINGVPSPGNDSGTVTPTDGGPGIDAGLDGGGSAPDSGAATPDAGTGAPDGGLALGTVVASSAACETGAQPGATCTNLGITCEGLSNTVQIAVSQPANPSSTRGTITMQLGGGGTAYWGSGATGGFVTPYTQQGFRAVQIKWSTAWENGSLGLRRAGCFPATMYDWIFRNVHGSDRTKGFCGQGSSGGSASLGYSMTQYGLASEFDYLLLANGPAVADLAVGCDVQDYTGPIPDICPSIPNPVYPLPKVVNGMEDTTTCSCGDAGCSSPADMQKWIADGVVSPRSVYDYPRTNVSFWLCGNNNNNGSTIGAFYYAALKAVPTNNVVADCWGGDAGPTSSCQIEDLFSDPNVLSAAIAAMTDPDAGCTARHGP